MSAGAFDPWAIIAVLERHRVNYVLIGTLAGVLHGTDEIADGVEVCPQMKTENVDRLCAALAELAEDATSLVPDAIRASPTTSVATSVGRIDIVPEPPGSAGWDDLRRASTREPLGRGVRCTVASVDDLGRVMTSEGRPDDRERLALLRRLSELDRSRGLSR